MHTVNIVMAYKFTSAKFSMQMVMSFELKFICCIFDYVFNMAVKENGEAYQEVGVGDRVKRLTSWKREVEHYFLNLKVYNVFYIYRLKGVNKFEKVDSFVFCGYIPPDFLSESDHPDELFPLAINWKALRFYDCKPLARIKLVLYL